MECLHFRGKQRRSKNKHELFYLEQRDLSSLENMLSQFVQGKYQLGQARVGTKNITLQIL
jgi:hypothetical protein